MKHIDLLHAITAENNPKSLDQYIDIKKQALVFEVEEVVLNPSGQGGIPARHDLLVTGDPRLGLETPLLP